MAHATSCDRPVMARNLDHGWKLTALVLRSTSVSGQPVDSYVNGSQTWLVEDGEITLEWRLHPVAGYRTPAPLSPLRHLGIGRDRSCRTARDPARVAPRRRDAAAHESLGRARVLRGLRRRARAAALAAHGHASSSAARRTGSASSTTSRSATRGKRADGGVSIVALLLAAARRAVTRLTVAATRVAVTSSPRQGGVRGGSYQAAGASPSIARNARSSQRCAPASGCGSASRAKKPTALRLERMARELAAEHPAVEHE